MDTQTILAQLSANMPEIRRRFPVESLSIFGSVARGENIENSDVDVVVTFAHRASFDNFMELKFYLEELLARNVDLVTEKALRPALRETIEQEMIRVA